MVLVLFFLSMIILIIIITSVLWVQIDVRNFKLCKEEKMNKIVNNNYEIFIYVYIFKKVKIFKYKINNKKIQEKYFKKLRNRLDLKILKSFIKNNFDYNNLKSIEIEKFNLDLLLGTENVILTSGIVTFLNILIPIILSKALIKISQGNYIYKVSPIYENKNKLKLILDSKINFRLFSLIKAFRSYILAKRSDNFKMKFFQKSV